jgi:hypothetical protein
MLARYCASAQISGRAPLLVRSCLRSRVIPEHRTQHLRGRKYVLERGAGLACGSSKCFFFGMKGAAPGCNEKFLLHTAREA